MTICCLYYCCKFEIRLSRGGRIEDLRRDSSKLGRDSANFEVYSGKLETDSAEFLDDSAKPLLITFIIK